MTRMKKSRPSSRWEDNIKMGLKKIRLGREMD